MWNWQWWQKISAPLETDQWKMGQAQNLTINKKSMILELSLWKWLAQLLVILTKLHDDSAKIVDFLITALDYSTVLFKVDQGFPKRYSIHHCNSSGYKSVRLQSFRSKKLQLRFTEEYVNLSPRCQIFSPTCNFDS